MYEERSNNDNWIRATNLDRSHPFAIDAQSFAVTFFSFPISAVNQEDNALTSSPQFTK